MADTKPGPSRPQQQSGNPTAKNADANRYGKKRRLSKNRQKRNKKQHSEQHLQQLEQVNLALANSKPNEETYAIIGVLQPSQTNINMVLETVKRDLHVVLDFTNNPCTIYEFGSIRSGLMFRDSDLDFYVHYQSEQTTREEQQTLIHQVYLRMRRLRTPLFGNLVKILGAKVPLLRAVHLRTKLTCDINFSNARGCYNSKFIYALLQYDRRIRELGVVIKYWVKCAYIINNHRQMNNYCIVMMLVFYLQTRKLPVIPSVEDMQKNIPRVNCGPWNLSYPQTIDYTTWNKSSFKELLIGFFKYYSEFEYSKNLISPFVGRLCTIQELQNKTIRELQPYYRAIEREEYAPLNVSAMLTIQDPFELNMNVGGVLTGEHYFEQFKLSFRHAYAVCELHRNDLSTMLQTLFADVQLYQKPSPKPPSIANAAPGGTDPTSARNAKETQWLVTRLTPTKYEKYVVQRTLDYRDPNQKEVITDDKIMKLWSESMLDFVEETLRLIFKVQLERIPNSAADRPEGTRRFRMSCERQVMLSRKRVRICNIQQLNNEISVSNARWKMNHPMKFSVEIELVPTAEAVEFHIPESEKRNGTLRLFMETCYAPQIRSCVYGFFAIMLAKGQTKGAAAPAPVVNPSSTEPAPAATLDNAVEAMDAQTDAKKDD